ncbi:enoyl-CoA hydratase-related protein [Fervidibacillus halotolerans]|uniref:Enoyl-CoA hydratase-related protein n=1 Tax=Fervidibacillus halotolerans TaxID=2980027 RepID=A0A9E8LY49_9BACI|nr:enoyl-CoA hydratase-related protein [Fervidibacillus halotolerans]WAA11847.1 enoyl-CoA hydratase-related protein [Fervidibacillus halotolerans]
METISIEKRNSCLIVTLNRPEALNAFNYQMLTELGEVVETIRYDTDVRVVIFTGAGEKSFSSGADLKERKNLGVEEVKRNVYKIRTVFQQIADLPQPVIAAVNGYAFGGGFELMLACDFRIAVKEAKMGLTEVSWGIIPGAGGTQRLPRLIGEAKAKELILTAKKFTAEEAFSFGLLTKVVEKDELMEESMRLAEKMMENGPIALTQAKYAINQGMNVDLKTGLEIEGKAYEVTIPTYDRLEALQAFAEKRKPNFKGK